MATIGVNKLKRTRAAYRAVLTKRLLSLAELGAAETIDRDVMSATIERIAETEQRIDKLQNELENAFDDETGDEELATLIDEYNAWKDEIRLVTSKAKQLFKREYADSRSETKSERNITMNLPKLNLPVFSGELTEWQMFYDSFCSSVHDRADISVVDKFSYLQSQLKGKALDVIKGFSLNAANYDTAFN